MQQRAKVLLTIKPDILDPAGTSVKKLLNRQGFKSVQDVRIGKLIDITFSSDKFQDLSAKTLDEIAKILSNEIVENYDVEMVEDR